MQVLFLIVFIDLVGFGVVIPLLPYYALRFGAPPLEVTLMMACYSLAQFISSPILGAAQRPRRAAAGTAREPACSVVSYVWLAAAPMVWMLFAARLIAGAGAGNIAAAQAYIADVTAPERRAKRHGHDRRRFRPGIHGRAGDRRVARRLDPQCDLARPGASSPPPSRPSAWVLACLRLKESLPAEPRATRRRGRDGSPWRATRWDGPGYGRSSCCSSSRSAPLPRMETTFALWASQRFGWGPQQVG